MVNNVMWLTADNKLAGEVFTVNVYKRTKTSEFKILSQPELIIQQTYL